MRHGSNLERRFRFTLDLNLAAAACLLLAGLAPAAVWTIDGTDSLLAAIARLDISNVSVNVGGTVTLAPELSPRSTLAEAAVWSVAADRAGNLYLGTGNSGRLFRVAPGGKPESVYASGSGEILAVTAAGNDELYFGITPGGTIYRMDWTGSQPAVACSTGEGYVFALTSSTGSAREPALLAATGPNGRLYSIARDRPARVVFTAPQSHLTSVCWLEPGRELLVGTSPDGIIYRLSFPAGVAAAATASVLYDTPLEEVRSIDIDADGRVYIGANPPGSAGGDSAGPRVYCVEPSGLLRWSWTCTDSLIFAIDASDRVLVATGNRGIVYELDSLGRASVRHRVDARQVLSLLPAADGLWLGTGNVARLYFAGRGLADSGFIAGPSHDCRNPVSFGRLTSRAAVPAGTSLAFDTRSGNSEKPDSTWTEWQHASDDIRSRAARFIQWRARFASRFPDLTPVLRRVDLSYRPVNRAPAVRRLDVAEPSAEEARRGQGRASRPVTWDAADPDGDSLCYSLYLRAENETSWLRLDSGLTDSKFDLDTRALPDGWYELRLDASDAVEQPAPDALTGSRTTGPLLVDNSPPRVLDVKAAADARRPGAFGVWFVGRDANSALAAARVSVNAGPWQPVDPEDGIADSSDERFHTTVDVPPGEAIIAIIVTDRLGNVGVGRVTVRR